MEETEARIIRALADSRLLGKPVLIKCAAANVSRSTWYRVLSDPLFVTRARAVYRHALESDRAAVMTALLVAATDPTRDGHQDRKLYFQLLGDLDEAGGRRKAEGSEDEKSVLKGMSDQELIETARELGLAVPAGVERRQEKP